jgi:hypothetical protein
MMMTFSTIAPNVDSGIFNRKPNNNVKFSILLFEIIFIDPHFEDLYLYATGHYGITICAPIMH